MYNYVDKRSGQKASLIADDVYEIIMKVMFVSDFISLFSTYSYCK